MNRTMARGTVLMAACLALSIGVMGAEGKSLEEKLDAERISLTLKDASVKKVLDVYKDLLGAQVDYQCAEDRKISISFEELKVRTSLSAICESAGLEWTLIPGPPAVLKITCAPGAHQAGTPRKVIKVEERGGPPPTGEGEAKAEVRVRKTVSDQGQTDVAVTINLKDADLADSMKMAARLLDAKLVMDSGLSGQTVTLQMKEVPIRDFLDAACKQAGAVWQLKPGDPPTLEVSKDS
jgi:type II secretory pathway component GspD/PulD (secretin)